MDLSVSPFPLTVSLCCVFCSRSRELGWDLQDPRRPPSAGPTASHPIPSHPIFCRGRFRIARLLCHSETSGLTVLYCMHYVRMRMLCVRFVSVVRPMSR